MAEALPVHRQHFQCINWTFWQLLVRRRHIPSTSEASTGPSVNILCVDVAFRQLPVLLWHFCQLPSTFHVAAGPSINFRQLSVRQRDLPSTLFAAAGPSFKLPCSCGTFRQLLLPFCAAWDFPSILHALAIPSVNFRHLSMLLETFHQLCM